MSAPFAVISTPDAYHMPTSLYCSQCGKHTPHVEMVMAYATACIVCGTHTASIMRNQAEAIKLKAPDGTEAVTVYNEPDYVTFYVPSGVHKGYYDYDKHTGKKTIRS